MAIRIQSGYGLATIKADIFSPLMCPLNSLTYFEYVARESINVCDKRESDTKS